MDRQCDWNTGKGRNLAEGWAGPWRPALVATVWSKLPFILSVFCLPGHTASLGSLLPSCPYKGLGDDDIGPPGCSKLLSFSRTLPCAGTPHLGSRG